MKKLITVIFLIFLCILISQEQYVKKRLFKFECINKLRIVSLIIFFVVSFSYPQQITFTSLNGPYGGNLGDVVFSSSGDIFVSSYYSDGKGVYKSTDTGLSWELLPPIYPFNEIFALGMNKEDNLFAGSGYYAGLFRSTDLGVNWSWLSGYTRPECWVIEFNDSNHIFAGDGDWGGLMRSTDNGDNWVQLLPDSVVILSIAIDSVGTIYVGASNNFLKSSDNGSTWNSFYSGIPPVEIATVLCHRQNEIFVGTGYILIGPYGGAGLENQLMYKLNAQLGEQWVVHIYQDSNNVYGYEIARLREVWEDEIISGSGIFTTLKLYTYYYSQDSTDTLGLVRYEAILAYGFGLRNLGGGDTFAYWLLKGCVVNDTLYGDTTNVVTSVKDLSENILSDFELYPNFPNPFNPNTTISFKIITGKNISLIVYDIMGREVKRLIDNDFYYSGIYKTIWDGKNNSNQSVSSGIYYYRLIGDAINITRPMILIK